MFSIVIMKNSTNKVTDKQHNTGEMVKAGVGKGLATIVAGIIESSIAEPIAGVMARFDELEKKFHEFEKKLWWKLAIIALAILPIIFGIDAYLITQIHEVKNSVVRLEVTVKQIDEHRVKFEKRFEERGVRVDKQLADLKIQITRVEGRMDGMEGRMIGIEGRMSGIEGRMSGMERRMSGIEGRMIGVEVALKQIFEFMKDKSKIGSPAPEALPEETDIGSDPDPDQPVTTPLVDQTGAEQNPYLGQPGSAPLKEQADVRPDVQPEQSEPVKPWYNDTGGGIGGPEGIPSE